MRKRKNSLKNTTISSYDGDDFVIFYILYGWGMGLVEIYRCCYRNIHELCILLPTMCILL